MCPIKPVFVEKSGGSSKPLNPSVIKLSERVLPVFLLQETHAGPQVQHDAAGPWSHSGSRVSRLCQPASSAERRSAADFFWAAVARWFLRACSVSAPPFVCHKPRLIGTHKPEDLQLLQRPNTPRVLPKRLIVTENQ